MRVEGNIINRVMEEGSGKQPEVGDGASVLLFSDRKAGTVTFASADLVIVRLDDAKVVSGSAHDGSAVYTYSPDPTGVEYYFMRVKRGSYKGQWRENGKPHGNGVIFGRRDHYYDPSF